LIAPATERPVVLNIRGHVACDLLESGAQMTIKALASSLHREMPGGVVTNPRWAVRFISPLDAAPKLGEEATVDRRLPYPGASLQGQAS
jgi:hypothetical protein